MYLVVFLDSSRRHTINDRISARVHGGNGIADSIQRECNDDTKPKYYIENNWIVVIVDFGQIQVIILCAKK